MSQRYTEAGKWVRGEALDKQQVHPHHPLATKDHVCVVESEPPPMSLQGMGQHMHNFLWRILGCRVQPFLGHGVQTISPLAAPITEQASLLGIDLDRWPD